MATHPNAARRMRKLRAHLLAEARASNGGRMPPCAICGHVPRTGVYRLRMRDGKAVAPHFYELDHVQELQDGGTNDLENLRLVCRACHYRRRRPEIPGAEAWCQLLAELERKA